MGPLATLFPINPRSIARLLDDIHEVAMERVGRMVPGRAGERES